MALASLAGADNIASTLSSSGEDLQTRKNDSLSLAIEETRAQELHDLTLLQETQKVKSTQLKNQQTEQKMELDLAKAQAEGLQLMQDPQGPDKKTAATGMMSPLWPSDGELVKEMLTLQHGNVSKGLLDAVDERMKQLKLAGERNTTQAGELDQYLRDELLTTLKKIDGEKHLAFTPFGKTGSFIGGLLDIVTGPLDLGTELFGGSPPSIQKAQILGSLISGTSPLVRAEIQDMFNREKMEQTASRYLGRRGLGNLSSWVSNGDMEGAEEITATAIDIRRLMEQEVPTSFGSEAVTGVGEAFNQFEEIHKLLFDLKEASTPEEAASIGQKLASADERMRQSVANFLRNGGTLELIDEEIIKAKDTINAKYQQPLEPMTYPGDTKATLFAARQKAVAKDFTDKLTELRNAIIQNVQFDPTLVKELQNNKDFGSLFIQSFMEARAGLNPGRSGGTAILDELRKKGTPLDVKKFEEAFKQSQSGKGKKQ